MGARHIYKKAQTSLLPITVEAFAMPLEINNNETYADMTNP